MAEAARAHAGRQPADPAGVDDPRALTALPGGGLSARFPAPLRGPPQAASSTAGAEPGSGFPAVSDMRQAAKPPITAAAIM